MTDDVTQVLSCGPERGHHPNLASWSRQALILGACPKCGTVGVYDDALYARMLAAFALLDRAHDSGTTEEQ